MFARYIKCSLKYNRISIIVDYSKYDYSNDGLSEHEIRTVFKLSKLSKNIYITKKLKLVLKKIYSSKWYKIKLIIIFELFIIL